MIGRESSCRVLSASRCSIPRKSTWTSGATECPTLSVNSCKCRPATQVLPGNGDLGEGQLAQLGEDVCGADVQLPEVLRGCFPESGLNVRFCKVLCADCPSRSLGVSAGDRGLCRVPMDEKLTVEFAEHPQHKTNAPQARYLL